MQAVDEGLQVVHNHSLFYKLQAVQSSGPGDFPLLVGRELVASDFALAGDAEDAEEDALKHAADAVRLAAKDREGCGNQCPSDP